MGAEYDQLRAAAFRAAMAAFEAEVGWQYSAKSEFQVALDESLAAAPGDAPTKEGDA